MRIKRGDVLYVDLGEHINDCIQGGKRPVVVVSNNKNNRYSSVFSVVPLTTKIFEKKTLPTHVFISTAENVGIRKESLALCEQITSISFSKIIEVNCGHVSDAVMEKITKAILIQVGVYEEYN